MAAVVEEAAGLAGVEDTAAAEAAVVLVTAAAAVVAASAIVEAEGTAVAATAEVAEVITFYFISYFLFFLSLSTCP